MRPTRWFLVLGSVLPALPASAQETSVDALERRIALLEAENVHTKALLAELAPGSDANDDGAWYKRITLGGYGEIKFHSENEHGAQTIDNDRFVVYLGYRFADWIQLHSEVELQHGKVEDGNGELSLEQLHFDFSLDDTINVRAGRFLVPVGLINRTHEPTSFFGVDRPDVETFVIPSTWMGDGVGLYGNLAPELAYELYVGSSLSGPGIDPIGGLHEARQEQTPSLHEPGVSGSLEWAVPVGSAQSLKLGASFFVGGLDNANNGVDPGIDAALQLGCVDAHWAVGDWELRALYTYVNIDGAANIGGNVASALDGGYVEAAWHCFPERWKEGRWNAADGALFARYERLDTQKSLPDGLARDPRGARTILTVGASFFPVHNLVFKADWQARDDHSAQGLPERFTLGLGWSF